MLVVGDATYDAASAPRMIEMLLSDHLDVVVGYGVDQAVATYRPGHRTGNWMLTSFLASVFGLAFKDILSGYRVFSRRFVKSFPVLWTGVKSKPNSACMRWSRRCRSPRWRRPTAPGRKDRSASSTPGATDADLGTILKLCRSEKPLRFFAAIGISPHTGFDRLAMSVIVTYLEESLFPGCRPRSCRSA